MKVSIFQHTPSRGDVLLYTGVAVALVALFILPATTGGVVAAILISIALVVLAAIVGWILGLYFVVTETKVLTLIGGAIVGIFGKGITDYMRDLNDAQRKFEQLMTVLDVPIEWKNEILLALCALFVLLISSMLINLNAKDRSE